MDDLITFLAAQLDEDERIARACSGNGDWDAEHIAIYDPVRVLREIGGRRRTLIRCQEAMPAANPMLVHFAKQTVREMAMPYKGRPGYEEALAASE